MKTQLPPFDFVLIPDFGDGGQPESIFLAEELSRLNSPYKDQTRIFDFGLMYESFCSNDDFDEEDKNIPTFVNYFWREIYQEKFLTFVVNFDFDDLNPIAKNLIEKKPDIKTFLYLDTNHIDGFDHTYYRGLNIKFLFHNGSVNKSAIQELRVTDECD